VLAGPAFGQKNWLFAGSGEAVRAVAFKLTVIQSALLHEAERFAYLSDLLTRLAEYRDMPGERKAAENGR